MPKSKKAKNNSMNDLFKALKKVTENPYTCNVKFSITIKKAK